MFEQDKPVAYGGYYQREEKAHDPELTHAGPGTPLGEYMRKFWHPVYSPAARTFFTQSESAP